MEEFDYEKHIEAIILAFTQNPAAYPTAERLAERANLIPGHPANDKLLTALTNPLIKITPRQLECALTKKQKAAAQKACAEQKEARKAEVEMSRSSKIVDLLGCEIHTEREMIPAFLQQGGWAMDFGGNFTSPAGRVVNDTAILEDIQLTAADIGLTRKPLELKDKNFQRALNEYIREARQNRKADLWAKIETLPDGLDASEVIADFERRCGYYFREPAFAAAAMMKVIWQVKRKLERLPIPYHHFVVLHSPEQGSGKTTVMAMLRQPIADLCKDVADVTDLLSNAQLDLFSYYLIEVPELSGAERADIPKLKALVTAGSVTRRVFFTQGLRDQYQCATFCGTTNAPLHALFKDPTGMRRMVQLDVKKIRDIRPHWHEIAEYDFTVLWQAVDHLGPDPMTQWMDLLAEKQEAMRSKDRVECWLDDFAIGDPPLGYDVASSKPPHTFQYSAKSLYQMFKVFEAMAFGSHGMTLSNWSLRFKDLIDSETIENWRYATHGRRTYFSHTRSNVVALPAPRTA